MDSAKKPEIDLTAAKIRLLAASESMSLRERIRRNPTKAVGGAVIGGLLAGSSAVFQSKAAETVVNAFVSEYFRAKNANRRPQK